METYPADKWCEDSLKEYEAQTQELIELRFKTNGEEESTLLRSARIRRAEKKLAVATIKADAASLVLQLRKATERGDIQIEIPEAQLDVELTWNERL